MTMYLASLSLWQTAMLVVVVPSALAMLGPLLVRSRIGLERLVVNNEVAGFKYAVVGVIFAVMLAFAVVVVWEKFGEAERAVVGEAGAAATIYRLADGFGPTEGKALEHDLSEYLEAAIREDWPAMAVGKRSHVVSAALDSLYGRALTTTRNYPELGPLNVELFRQLDAITYARRTRLHLSLGIVPNVLWAVLVSGAAFTVIFTLFFGTRNVVAQIMMTAILAIMTSLGLFVILEIDHPFTGPVSIEPHVLESVLADFNSHEPGGAVDAP